jgi:release factor glutamine methyltransferase
MQIQAFIPFIQNQLAALYEPEEAKQIGYILLEEILLIKRSHLPIIQKEIGADEEEKLTQIILELKKGVPLQYVLGYAWFKNLVFKVSPAVLIPRPETEELVDWILADYANIPLKVLDIGTGSGCIAIALSANRSNWEIWGIDLSKDAIDVAQSNARSIQTNTKFKVADLFDPSTQEWIQQQQFDLIVSNPPYIPETDKAQMHVNVLNHEPHEALFVSDEKPLVYFETLLAVSEQACYVEFAYNLEPQMKDLLRQSLREYEIKKDMSGNPRMCKWNKRK